jgi:hypothetical protein
LVRRTLAPLFGARENRGRDRGGLWFVIVWRRRAGTIQSRTLINAAIGLVGGVAVGAPFAAWLSYPGAIAGFPSD